MLGSLWFGSFSAGGAPSGAGDYELISTTVLGSSAASVTFSGLGTSAAAYKHLQMRITARNTIPGPTDDLNVRFNSDTAGNYAMHQLYGNGSSVASEAYTNTTLAASALIAGNTATANAFGVAVIDILDFSQTTKNKTIRGLSGIVGASSYILLRSNHWRSTATVTQIDLSCSGSFATGSRFSLYGLK